MSKINPQDFVISRKRKRYKFAQFANFDNCYELDQIDRDQLNATQIIEIGAGKADFSLSLAQAYPAKKLVALDVKGDRLQAGAQKALELGLANLSFVRSFVEPFALVFEPDNLEQLWITFPDPYPKERSAKHRLTYTKYLEFYKKWLSGGGKLYFKTDSQALFDFSIEQLEANDWQILETCRDLHDSDLDEIYKQPTAYERRYQAEGKPICFLIAKPA